LKQYTCRKYPPLENVLRSKNRGTKRTPTISQYQKQLGNTNLIMLRMVSRIFWWTSTFLTRPFPVVWTLLIRYRNMSLTLVCRWHFRLVRRTPIDRRCLFPASIQHRGIRIFGWRCFPNRS
uniref:Secreted protein n=1 Tax=Haemonchus placei TaxID=6290 RepID=A0A0N4W8H9_HAEPC